MIMGDNTSNEANVKIGEKTIMQSRTSKLLGMDMDSDQKWKTHFNGLVTALDRRLFQIRRVAGHISGKGLKKVADSIWTSKLRYGLQLCTEVRTDESQKKNTDMIRVQKAQNRLMRVLTKTRRMDRTKIGELLEKTGMLSVNQTAAQIKYLEMWKATHNIDYPLKLEMVEGKRSGIATRQSQESKFKEINRTQIGKHSFVGDATKLWNQAPEQIKQAKTVWGVKKEIKKHCKTLPII